MKRFTKKAGKQKKHKKIREKHVKKHDLAS